MENVQSSETGTDVIAPPPEVDQVARLKVALGRVGNDGDAEIEIWRIRGTGRGTGGGQVFVDSISAGDYSVGELLRLLRDKYKGGKFRLYSRRADGSYLLNEGVETERTGDPDDLPAARPQPQDIGTVVAAAVAQALAQANPPRDEEAELRRFKALKDLFAPPTAPAAAAVPAQPQQSLVAAIREAKELVAELDGTGGAGKKSDNWLADVVTEWSPILLDVVRGNGTGGGDEETPADAAAAEEAVKKQLGAFGGMLVKGAEGNVPPAAAAQFALSKAVKKDALVRFCQGGNAVGQLCQITPELLKHTGWLEQVRAEIVKQGAAKLQAPAPEQGAKHDGHDARTDTGRGGGRRGNTAKNAAAGRSGKAPASRSPAGGKAGGRATAKGLPGRGGKAAPVRKK